MIKKPTYFAYIRVSTVKQGKHSVSLPEQKNAIQAFAQREGFAISEWFEEKETAAKRGRPIFGKMLKGLKEGKAKGVIIHKIDRGARNLKDWADLADLMDMGVEVHTANENLDLTSRGGRLTADLQAVVAADYIRNLREETKKGLYGRLKQGIYPFAAPIGYLDTGRGNVKSIDPVKAPLVKKLFELYATGSYSLTDLREKSIALGLYSKSGKPLSRNSLSLMLNNPFYTGLIQIRKTGETFDGKHTPLIRPSVYRRVQDVLQGKRVKKIYVHNYQYRKLFTCALCGTAMIAERQKGHVYYRCHTKGCITKGVRENQIEDTVSNILSPLRFSPMEMEALWSCMNDLKGESKKIDMETQESYEMQLGKIDSRLQRLTDVFVDGDLDKELFTKRKNSLLTEQKEIQEKLYEKEASSSQLIRQAQEFLELSFSAQQGFLAADQEDRREILKTVSSNRKVNGKDVVVELDMPFSLFANRPVCDQSCHSRYDPRTLAGIFAEVVEFFREKIERGK